MCLRAKSDLLLKFIHMYFYSGKCSSFIPIKKFKLPQMNHFLKIKQTKIMQQNLRRKKNFAFIFKHIQHITVN